MNLSNTTVAMLVTVFFSLSSPQNVLGQATVRDSTPVSAVELSPAQSAPPSNMAYQVQQLQQEVLELRGLLEEQAFQLKRLKQQRLDDYLDLDKRISNLSGSGQSTLSSSDDKNSLTSSTDSSLVNSASTSLVSSATDNSEAEKKLYREGIDKLLNQQDYQGAQTSFNEYLQKFPQGSYAPNVYYWQGQIYLSEGDKGLAEKSFTTLLDNYSSHQKATDAKYKLATIYFDQGKKAEAKILLEEVAASNTDVARLAKSFLTNQYQ
jgi:tol-pal system protein YbgF